MSRVVKEHIGVIILGIFIFFAVIAPAGCIVWARRREHRKYHPSPNAFRKARRKLATVAECRKDTERHLGGGDSEWTGNCPICIGPLTAEANGSSAENISTEKATTEDATEATAEATTEATTEPAPPVAGSSTQNNTQDADGSGSSKEIMAAPTSSTAETRRGGGDGSAAETQTPPTSTKEGGCSPIMLWITRWLPRSLQKKCKIAPDRDVEILKLKSCGHWFHARCLSSWFLIDRYDCPVCRKPYWDGKPKKGPLSTWLTSNYNVDAVRVGAGTMV
ncbi:hypothetical protein SAPIO_CDS10459 [Scedosporium apiospermum]|uniref:RING-type domain-containing protein n=1 Tax=Pseudallescheria apiosperma TaxID=563466 RepID=A0A084FVG2_PSEDA|nr:uncharacterized protein SAPIO_CDS10459 [Scedosporium apiospermum]KEZ39074.1 hypothetical protein SAPIO_CDS10459 [Scedosporium apiospermum]